MQTPKNTREIPPTTPHYQPDRKEGGEATDENFSNNPDHPLRATQTPSGKKLRSTP